MQSSWSAPFKKYELDSVFYDEMFDVPGVPRGQYEALYQALLTLSADEIDRYQQAADASFLHQGITFTVYGNEKGTERIFPYDLLPRIITRDEWATIESGLKQRITALNLFLHDVYHKGQILADGILPYDLVYTCQHYRREMVGVNYFL